jgi:CrcB protein
VFLGGGTGALLRWGLGRAVPGWAGTLTINVLGCFLMGLLAGSLLARGPGEGWRLLLGIGLLGGFTTFSAFSLDAVGLLQRQPAMGLLYIGLSVAGSLIAFGAGLLAVRLL